jgi:dynein heavy chain 1
MIRTLIVETYGGKIDDEGDFARLTQLVNSFLTPSAYDIGHKLVEGIAGSGLDDDDGSLVVPSGTTLKDFTDWIQKLPEREPPTYLGLPANAEKLLLVGQGHEHDSESGEDYGAIGRRRTNYGGGCLRSNLRGVQDFHS